MQPFLVCVNRKRKELVMKKGQIVEGIIERVDFPNKGILRTEDGTRVIVKNAIMGQKVSAAVNKVRKGKCEGRLLEILEKSALELPEPGCVHYGICGGCTFQSLPYEEQLKMKEKQVKDLIDAVITEENKGYEFLPIKASPRPKAYRNKMEFAFGVSGDGGKALGLRERGSRNIVEVTGCLLQTPLTMRVLEAVRMLSNGAFHDLDGRFLVVREPNAGGCFVELIVGAGGSLEAGERFAEALRAETPEVTGFALSERLAPSDVAYGERALYADGRLEERIGDVRLQMGHNAFFQVNTPAAELLYAEAARFAALEELPDPVLWDVYGGVGSIGLYMGRNARVVGIEEMPGAVRYARGNAKALGRKAYKVEQGDAKSVLGRLVKLGPKPDVVVVDPPRAGIDAKVAQQLAEAAPLRLVYVSCNPATLARDVARLAPAFRLKAARPVDLFPQTPHVETVALLERA